MRSRRDYDGFEERNRHNLLLVTGERIRLVTLPVREAAVRRHPGVPTAKTLATTTGTATRSRGHREVYQLHVSNYVNGEACSPELRDIREAVEVRDFQRLLAKYRDGGDDDTRNKCESPLPISCIDADRIYEDFYGDCFRYLRHVTGEDA